MNALRPSLAITPHRGRRHPAAARHLVLHLPRDLVRGRRLQAQCEGRAQPAATSRCTSCSFRSSSPDRSSAGATSPTQIAGRERRIADFAYGVRRFVLGLGKKVLIANTLGRGRRPIFPLPHCRADHAARLAGPRLLHAADLLRFLRLLGHGDGPDAACSASASSRTSTIRTSARIDPRVLAALAYFAVELVSRLPVHSARRQPRGRRRARTAISSSCSCCADCGTARAGPSCSGALARAFLVAERAGLDRVLGRDRTARARLRAAGGDGRLGAVPQRDAHAGRGLLRGTLRCSARGSRAASAAGISRSLRLLYAGGRDGVRHAARPLVRTAARSNRHAFRCSGRRWRRAPTSAGSSPSS